MEKRPVSSQEIRLQEKVCIFDNNDNIVMFDQDNTLDQRIQSQREIFGGENCNPNREMINRIQQQIKSSKENFFNVKVVKGDRPKKMLRSQPLQLASKNKQQAQLIIKEGFLDKKYNSNIFFKWNKRFFALNSDKLYCFADKGKDKIIACINFKRLPARLIDTNGLEIQVDFFGQSQGLILKCQNAKDKKQWTEAIGSVIEIHCLENKMLFKTLSKEFYQDKDSLTEKQFMSMCQTGDVLLFYTNHTGGKIQRFLTQSQYDHVAMIVKFDKDQAMVFEANQVSGVALYDWKYYIHYFDLYQKVAIRKLKYIKKQELHTKLLSFVKKNIGKKYDLSAMKLFKQQSNFQWDSLKQQERGFFCSQLVAKAYKSVGLLEPRKASSKYWPVDFSQKAELKLNYGAQLDKEKIIVLNKHLKKQL